MPSAPARQEGPASESREMTSPRIDRISAEDQMSLTADTGSAPMQVGAIITLCTQAGDATALLRDTLTRRIRAVPRLRQRLVTVPFGCGRPLWISDSGFDAANHLDLLPCPAPGGEEAVLRIAADMLVRPLPQDRPLWVAKLITGVDADHAALIFVFHHVLTDGIGGLAVLETLAGAVDEEDQVENTEPPPSELVLAMDALKNRVNGVVRLPTALRRLGAAASELRPQGRGRLARTSLNRPTGPRRELAVVRCELEAIKTASNMHGVTVNDLVLTAVAAALYQLLRARGENVEQFVVSVPFSSRRQTTASHLGNQNGVIPVPVPAVGPVGRRLATVAETTKAAKQQTRGASSALLGPLSRFLVRIGVFRHVIDHQRLVHTFITNLRGPERPLTLSGIPIAGVVPLGAISGNITVAFAVLSYSDTLTITIIADPETCPDLKELGEYLKREIQTLTTFEEA